MNGYLALGLLLVLVVVQSTLAPLAALGPAKPIVPLLAVVSWGLLRGPMAAAWWALVSGLLMDALSPAPFGLYTVPMLVAAGVTAAGQRRISSSHLLVPAIVAALATAAYLLVQRVLLVWVVRAASAPLPSWSAWSVGQDLLPPIVLNLLWLPLLYFPLRLLAERTAPPRMLWER